MIEMNSHFSKFSYLLVSYDVFDWNDSGILNVPIDNFDWISKTILTQSAILRLMM